MSALRLVAALALAPLVGCIVVVEGEGDFHADLVVSEPCGLVSIQLDAGDVSVVRADISDVQISWGATGVADAPHVVAEVVDGVLALEGRCGEGLSCGVDVALLVPSGMALDIETGSGDVSLTGTDAGATVETGSGDVALVCVAGELAVTTGAGDIAGSCLQSTALFAETGGGDVALAWTGPVHDAQVHTGTGDVLLGVLYGDYDLDLFTGSGDIVLAGVNPSDDAPAHLWVTSGAGDLVLTGL